MDEKVSAPTPNYAYQYQIDYINTRLERLEKKCKILIAIMVDKKLISEEIAKVIYETNPKDQLNLIEWYLKENELKK